jgi:hypothetical protein
VRAPVLLFGFAAPVLAAACAGGGAPSGGAASPSSSAARCDPGALTPSLVGMKTLDLASFESILAMNVVFVHYDGCHLEVLDGCADESVPGRFGTYLPPLWTEPSERRFTIHGEDELLGAYPFAAPEIVREVDRGTELRVTVFIGGSTQATRATESRSALAAFPGCARATHFVFALRLGAAEIAGSPGSPLLVREGDLSGCSGARDEWSHTCRAPVDVTLRPIGP